jgi:hypothetical protein
MTRRSFLTRTSGAASLSLLGLSPGGAQPSPDVDPIVDELVRAHDERVASVLARQERRAGHPMLGGVPDAHGLHSAYGPAGLIGTLVCASHAPASAHYRSMALVEPLELAARALLAIQHDDGTIDLPATNFKSPPDTAFVLEGITAAATILRRNAWEPHRRLEADLRTFIEKAGAALATGGVHTPNHRWVVCAALARVHALYPDSRYVERVDRWLAEGIDLDPDGQYTEKSTTVYSPVVDRALLNVAALLGRPGLRDYVRKNLEMTLHYVHPDGEVVTEASKRQDRYVRGSMGRYYYSYRSLALLDGNRRFAAMARQIERTARAQIVGEVAAFLEEPELARPMPPDGDLPVNYAKAFPYSKLVRIRRGAVSATVLADNSTLFSLRKGGAALEAVRLASAFFGKGQFVGDEVKEGGGAYRLRQTLEGPYFQPLSPDQIAQGEHVRMAPNGTLASDSRSLRATSNVQHLESLVEVTEREGRFTLAFEIAGTDRVPVAIELAFRHGGRLEGVEPVEGIANAFLLRGSGGRFVQGEDVIEFGPGLVGHTWTQLRGALPKWDGQSVYLTGLTPFRFTLSIG